MLSSSHPFCSFFSPRWTIKGLLRRVANGGYSALIDTGALITGMSNYEVAAYLLEVGLADMDGVVFLDDWDRKMILIRAGAKVMELSQCGVAKRT